MYSWARSQRNLHLAQLGGGAGSPFPSVQTLPSVEEGRTCRIYTGRGRSPPPLPRSPGLVPCPPGGSTASHAVGEARPPMMLGGGQAGARGDQAGGGRTPSVVTKPHLGLPPPLDRPAPARPRTRARCPLRAGGGASCAGRSSCACAWSPQLQAPGVGWALYSDPEVEAYEVILESRLLEQRWSAR